MSRFVREAGTLRLPYNVVLGSSQESQREYFDVEFLIAGETGQEAPELVSFAEAVAPFADAAEWAILDEVPLVFLGRRLCSLSSYSSLSSRAATGVSEPAYNVSG